MLVGVPVGFAVGVNRYAAHALEGFLRFLQGISGIAWLPLAIIWFGFSHTTTLVIVIYSLIVPIIFNTMIGVRAIPRTTRWRCARSAPAGCGWSPTCTCRARCRASWSACGSAWATAGAR